MNNKYQIISLNAENISEYKPLCFLNPKNEGYLKKHEWSIKRFKEGMRIKQLYFEGEKKAAAFIEYIPGEYAWRAVDAKGYMFIHCIWISANKNKGKGYGSLLINECIKDAEKEGLNGVAALTSEGAFMAGKNLFLKNGFSSIAKAKPSFELMVRSKKNDNLPKFMDWEKQLEKYKGLNFVYSDQCPWVARSINELGKIAKEKGVKVNVIELKTAQDAQNAPSLYGVFNLVYNGKLLANHYISGRRFMNILDKELK